MSSSHNVNQSVDCIKTCCHLYHYIPRTMPMTSNAKAYHGCIPHERCRTFSSNFAKNLDSRTVPMICQTVSAPRNPPSMTASYVSRIYNPAFLMIWTTELSPFPLTPLSTTSLCILCDSANHSLANSGFGKAIQCQPP